jgi:cytochrome P450
MLQDPTDLYQTMMDRYGPVAPVLLGGDVPAWLILGYEANREVLRNDAVFSRDARLWRERIEGRVPAGWEYDPHTTWRENALFATGANHVRLRGSINRSIAQTVPRRTRHFVEDHADALIDAFCAEGCADLVQQFAAPLSMMVLLRLMGLDESQRRRLTEAHRVLLESGEGAREADAEILQIMVEHVRRRRAQPAEDLGTFLIGDEAALTDSEVAEQLWLLLNGGFGCTMNLIANVGAILLTSRRMRNDLSSGFMDIRSAIRTALWDRPPVEMFTGRWPVRDVDDILGAPVRAGDLIIVGLAAANVDCKRLNDVDSSSWTDHNEAHLAFGGGMHGCPAPDLGREIAYTALERLFTRLPDLALLCPDEPLDRGPSLIASALRSLLITFDPADPRFSRRVPAATAMGDM